MTRWCRSAARLAATRPRTRPRSRSTRSTRATWLPGRTTTGCSTPGRRATTRRAGRTPRRVVARLPGVEQPVVVRPGNQVARVDRVDRDRGLVLGRVAASLAADRHHRVIHDLVDVGRRVVVRVRLAQEALAQG